MNEFEQIYLKSLSDKIAKIILKDELTANDVDLFKLYQNEIKRMKYKSPFKRFLSGVEDVFSFISKNILGSENNENKAQNNENIDTGD